LEGGAGIGATDLKQIRNHNGKVIQMFAKGKKQILTTGTTLLNVLLWVGSAVVPLACLTINRESPPDNQPRTEVDVGGHNGVDVHRSDSGTEVKVGGDRGVVVEHPRD
jgi:hypothetical protein